MFPLPPSNEGPAQHTGTVIIPNLIKFHVKLPSSILRKKKGKKLKYGDKKRHPKYKLINSYHIYWKKYRYVKLFQTFVDFMFQIRFFVSQWFIPILCTSALYISYHSWLKNSARWDWCISVRDEIKLHKCQPGKSINGENIQF